MLTLADVLVHILGSILNNVLQNVKKSDVQNETSCPQDNARAILSFEYVSAS